MVFIRFRGANTLRHAIHEFDVEESQMSREAAKKIIDLMVRHGAEQDAVLAEIRSVCTDEEFQSYKRMIGQSMGVHVVGRHQSNRGNVSGSEAGAAGIRLHGGGSALSRCRTSASRMGFAAAQPVLPAEIGRPMNGVRPVHSPSIP
jgi:hypothetical protein